MRRLFFLWLVLILTVATISPLAAEPAALQGTWNGSGTMQAMDKAPQKLTCRINYKRETDKVFKLAAKCATISTAINQTGQLLKVNPGVYVGEFHVASYDISGRVRVVIQGEVQTMSFKSSRANGTVTLKKS
ncbi:MAG: hypothetical protein QNJ62_10670 [Methyloceanibacter sp.]|nr:hypothetical protein [Methyloceanibacter sp.]